MLGTLTKTSNAKPCDTIGTLIGAMSEFKGNVVFSGGLRIDGKVKGNITAQAGNSILILGDEAEVCGNITVPHIITNGKIKGNVHCSQRIELEPKAAIHGDVHCKLIEIALGATISGRLIQETVEGTEKNMVTQLKPVAAPGDDTSRKGIPRRSS
ncbi:MAG: polymer-forming cytoskeletal protein [Acidiferrobacterales bacterium]